MMTAVSVRVDREDSRPYSFASVLTNALAIANKENNDVVCCPMRLLLRVLESRSVWFEVLSDDVLTRQERRNKRRDSQKTMPAMMISHSMSVLVGSHSRTMFPNYLHGEGLVPSQYYVE